eukprot:351061-Chlamydomonas_euryale.AAC.1
MPGRRWSDGLHQAVEAKEGLDIQQVWTGRAEKGREGVQTRDVRTCGARKCWRRSGAVAVGTLGRAISLILAQMNPGEWGMVTADWGP